MEVEFMRIMIISFFSLSGLSFVLALAFVNWYHVFKKKKSVRVFASNIFHGRYFFFFMVYLKAIYNCEVFMWEIKA